MINELTQKNFSFSSHPPSQLLKIIARQNDSIAIGNDKHKPFHWLKTHSSDWQNVNQYTVTTPVFRTYLKGFFFLNYMNVCTFSLPGIFVTIYIIPPLFPLSISMENNFIKNVVCTMRHVVMWDVLLVRKPHVPLGCWEHWVIWPCKMSSCSTFWILTFSTTKLQNLGRQLSVSNYVLIYSLKSTFNCFIITIGLKGV